MRIVCECKISIKLEWKVYKTAIRPTTLYNIEMRMLLDGQVEIQKIGITQNEEIRLKICSSKEKWFDSSQVHGKSRWRP